MTDCIVGSCDASLKIDVCTSMVGQGNYISHHSIRDIDLSIIAMISYVITFLKQNIWYLIVQNHNQVFGGLLKSTDDRL